jgi:hypothetical protein
MELEPQPTGFLEAWKIPGVASYAIAHACLKVQYMYCAKRHCKRCEIHALCAQQGADYGLFFWLPVYLETQLGMSSTTTDLFSVHTIALYL